MDRQEIAMRMNAIPHVDQARIERLSAAALAALPLVILFASAAPGQETPANFLVPDVETQFFNLKHHPESLAFNRHKAEYTDICRHYQGIVRYDAPDGTPYMILTRSGSYTGIWCPLTTWCGSTECPGELVVVQMGSRDRTGRRLRSNRLALSDTTLPFPSASTDDTPPPGSDSGIASKLFNGAWGPDSKHPGGICIVGDIVFVPLEGDDGNKLVLVSLAAPANPQVLCFYDVYHKAGMVGIVREADRFLLVVGGEDDGRVLHFYTFMNTALQAPALDLEGAARSGHLALEWLDSWNSSSLPDPSIWPTGKPSYQSISMVQDTNGTFYLIGSHNTSALANGEDWLHLYQLDRSGNNYSLTFVRGTHLWCDFDGTGRTCNCAAGGGAYVTFEGDLIFYSSEHENAGPHHTVRFAEFRNRDVTFRGQLGPCDAWVELYEEPNCEGRSVMYDWVDRSLENWEDLYYHDNFGDKASSVRWFAPEGTEFRLYEDDGFSGDYLRLEGRGHVSMYSDLRDTGWNDRIDSVIVARLGYPGAVCAGLMYLPPVHYMTLEDALNALTGPCSAGSTILLWPGVFDEAPRTIRNPVILRAPWGPAEIR